jgi:hypothetical protein
MVMNDEMKSMSNEGVAAQSKVLLCIAVSRYLLGQSKGNPHSKIHPLRIFGVKIDTRSGHLPNIKHELHRTSANQLG